MCVNRPAVYFEVYMLEFSWIKSNVICFVPENGVDAGAEPLKCLLLLSLSLFVVATAVEQCPWRLVFWARSFIRGGVQYIYICLARTTTAVEEG